MEHKIQPTTILLLEDTNRVMNEVSTKLMIRDPMKIGHKFTLETIKKLKNRRGEFLLPMEEEEFISMLERHGKSFTFLKEIM